MKTMKHNLRNVVLVVVAALFSATGAFGQDGRPGATIKIPCPSPQHVVSKAPTATTLAATPNTADFPTACSSGWEPNFGGTTINKCFRHTFTLKLPNGGECCQCVDGKNTLTIQYKALEGAAAGSGSANDQWNILKGTVLAAHGWLYGNGNNSVTTGQPGTMTIPLKCEWLTNNRLSFFVQDDTSVTSATLDVTACCVNVVPAGPHPVGDMPE